MCNYIEGHTFFNPAKPVAECAWRGEVTRRPGVPNARVVFACGGVVVTQDAGRQSVTLNDKQAVS